MSRRRPPRGAPPGTLTPPVDALPLTARVVWYSAAKLWSETVDADALETFSLPDDALVWIDAVGFGDGRALSALAGHLGIHPLVLADMVHLEQRPKIEAYAGHVYAVMRMPHSRARVHLEQVSLVLGKGFVLTLQEHEGDCFDPVRRRLEAGGHSRLRSAGPDYLAYALIDAVVDAYFPVVDAIGARLEELEGDVLQAAEPSQGPEIHALKADLLNLRRVLLPTREMLAVARRNEEAIFAEDTLPYLRDVQDHASQHLDLVEVYHGSAASLLDLHLAGLGAKTNEAMRTLTVIATIFIPLSFLAGLYGMNFDHTASDWNMPELHWAYGYPALLAVMASVAGGLLFWFWRRGWLGGVHRRRRRHRRRKD